MLGYLRTTLGTPLATMDVIAGILPPYHPFYARSLAESATSIMQAHAEWLLGQDPCQHCQMKPATRESLGMDSCDDCAADVLRQHYHQETFYSRR